MREVLSAVEAERMRLPTPEQLRAIAGYETKDVTFQTRGRLMDRYAAARIIYESGGECMTTDETGICSRCTPERRMCDIAREMVADDQAYLHEIGRGDIVSPVATASQSNTCAELGWKNGFFPV